MASLPKPGKTKGSIPDDIWEKIFILEKSHPPSRLRAILGISTTQYNKIRQRRLAASSPLPPSASSTPTPAPAPAIAPPIVEENTTPLIEWRDIKEKPVYQPAKGLATNTIVVELTRSDGRIMKIHTTDQSFKELIQVFFAGDAPYAATLP